MRRACCASSLLSSRSAASDSSTLQAMTFHCLFEWDGTLRAAANPFQRALGQVQIFEIVQVFEDSFPRIERLGTPGAAGEPLQALFNGLR